MVILVWVGWQHIISALQAQVILSDIATQHTYRVVYHSNLYNLIPFPVLVIWYDTWPVLWTVPISYIVWIYRSVAQTFQFSRCLLYRKHSKFLPIFVHPDHFQNGARHTCKDFRSAILSTSNRIPTRGQ